MEMFSWHPRHRDRLWVGLLSGMLAVALFLLVPFVASCIALALNGWGYANLAAIGTLLLWQFADTIFRPRWIYGLFGLEQRPFTPQLRLWRRFALLTLTLLAIANSVIVLTPADGRAFPAAAIAPTTVLTAAYLAALGWMYTAFEKERLDRATQSLAAAQAQLSGATILTLYNQIVEQVRLYKAAEGLGRSDALPMEAMRLELAGLNDSSGSGKPLATLEEVTVQFLNQCDHIALGVREGLFDFRSIQLLLRQRFIRLAFLFSPYIKEITNAVPDNGRVRATALDWEHYLWLVHHLMPQQSDEVDPKAIVLPPKARPHRPKSAKVENKPKS